MQIIPRREFSDEPVMILKNTIEVYSPEILGDHRTLERMLNENDKKNEFQREIFLLMLSLRDDIPLEIIGGNHDCGGTLRFLSFRFQEKYSIQEHAAQWAVSSWAKALEITQQAQKRGVDDMHPRIESKRFYNNQVDKSGVILWNIPLIRN